MSAESLSRQSMLSFILGRVLRLGLPVVAYTLLLQPLSFLWTIPRPWTLLKFKEYFTTYWKQLRGVLGPPWSVATLLVFDCAAVILSALHARFLRTKILSADAYRRLATYGWVCVSLTSILVRSRFPGSRLINPTRTRPAYTPGYVYAYTLGFLAPGQGAITMAGPNLSNEPPWRAGGHLLAALLAAHASHAAAVAPVVLAGGYKGAEHLAAKMWDQFYSGGWSLESAAHALFMDFSGFVLMGPALMRFCRRYCNRPMLAKALFHPRYSYAAHLIHFPICLWISLGIQKILDSPAGGILMKRGASRAQLTQLVMAGLGGFAVTASSFAVSRWVVEQTSLGSFI